VTRALHGIFVVGTDTGVGKTFVAAALCRALRLSGRAVVGVKPYETGCRPRASDAAALEREARSGLPLELRCPFRFREPVAPAVAAELEVRRHPILSAAAVVREAGLGRYAVVESAGGLMSPLDGASTNLDLAVALRLPVILVARNALGTLNHLGLTVETLQRRRLRIRAIVLSRGTSPQDPSQATNAEWARRLTSVQPVIELERTSVLRAARELGKRVDLW
jgi:dethiobiotin synthetase